MPTDASASLLSTFSLPAARTCTDISIRPCEHSFSFFAVESPGIAHSADARMLVMRSFKLPDNAPDTHVKLQNLKPSLRDRIKTQAKEILLDDEGRKGRCVLAILISARNIG